MERRINNELISVIIPVYNVEKYIEKCVTSIINQTYSNIEIILIDDGSKDSSGKICDSLSDRDPRIRCIHKENGGLSDARNVGLKHVDGKYVTFIDSDDYVDKKYIEILYATLKKYDVEFVISNFKKVLEDSVYQKASDSFDERVFSKEEALAALYSDELKYQFTMAVGKLYSVRMFENIKFPSGRNYEDTATAHLFINQVDKLVYITREQYFYLTRKTSITKSDRYLKDDIIDAVFERMCFFELNNYSELLKKAQIQYLTTMMGVYARQNAHNYERKSMLFKRIKEFWKKKGVTLRGDIKVNARVQVFLLAPRIYSFFVRKLKK